MDGFKNAKEFFRRIVVFVLTLEAKAILKKYRPKILLVTGSVGKTSAKDAAYSALSGSFFVRRSEKSFNSDIGVPLTILGVPNGWANPLQWLRNIIDGASLIIMDAPYPKWLVMEVGADRPGDITKSLSWLKPDVVVATRFPTVSVHVEFYNAPSEVIEEELAPAHWLPEDGIFVLNADDKNALEARTRVGVKRITYGFGSDAMLKAMHVHVRSRNKVPTGLSFDLSYQGEHAHMALDNVAGRSHVYAVMAGVGAALGVGVSLSDATKQFLKHELPPGRMNLISGIRKSTIIDDSYNSSPVAAEEALRALSDIPHSGRRIAVLADMLELGSHSLPEHVRIGALVPASADILVTVGVRARDIAKGAREAGMDPATVIECDRGADAASQLVSLIQPGDVILVKGSQSMRMERVVKSLMARPERAKELLVRQDAEWLSRE